MDQTGSGASAGAQCAVHAGREASQTCTRCGNFGCETCFADAAGARFDRCASCREREGIGQIPWEGQGSLFRRYTATVEAALRTPTATFGALRGGELRGAITFAVISCGIGMSPYVLGALALGAAFSTDDRGLASAAILAVTPVLYPAISLVFFSLAGATFHAAARLAGGRASFRESMRAGCYTTAWEPVAGIIAPLVCIPALGVLLLGVMSTVSAVWRVTALRAFAERVHGLSRGRATAVSAVAAFALLLMWVTPVVLVIGFAIYQRSTLRSDVDTGPLSTSSIVR